MGEGYAVTKREKRLHFVVNVVAQQRPVGIGVGACFKTKHVVSDEP